MPTRNPGFPNESPPATAQTVRAAQILRRPAERFRRVNEEENNAPIGLYSRAELGE